MTDMTKIKTFAVKNRSICNRLVNKGFELLNVTKNRDNPTEPCFIFERTDDFIKAFDDIQDEIMSSRRDKDIGLTEFERDFVCDILIHKRDEYKTLGVKNVDTLDSIIDKLRGKKKGEYNSDSKALKSNYIPVKSLPDITKHPNFEAAQALMAQRHMDNMMRG